MIGFIRRTVPSGGYCFLVADGEDQDIFAHYRQFQQNHSCLIQPNEPVEFEVHHDADRTYATRVRLLSEFEIPTKDVLAEVRLWDGDQGWAAHVLCGCQTIFLTSRKMDRSFRDRLSVGDRILCDLVKERGQSMAATNIRIPEEKDDGSIL